jgi:hypothetical protein
MQQGHKGADRFDHGILECRERRDWHNRAEWLLVHNARVQRHVRQNRRLKEEAIVAQAPSTCPDARAALNGVRDQRVHRLDSTEIS